MGQRHFHHQDVLRRLGSEVDAGGRRRGLRYVARSAFRDEAGGTSWNPCLFCRNRGNSGKHRRNIGRNWGKLDPKRPGPESISVQPMLTDFRPRLLELGQSSSGIDRNGPGVGQMWPDNRRKLASGFVQSWPECGQTRPTRIRNQPNLAGPHSTELARIRSNWGQRRLSWNAN